MNFLIFGFPSWDELKNGFLQEVCIAAVSTLQTFLYGITEKIYSLIVIVYNLFDKLCTARMLDNDVLKEMSTRIGYILGTIMFFYVIFSFIQMLIDPEKITNKDSGALSLVKKILIVLLLLAFSNSIFGILFKFQNEIIDKDVLPRLILPYTVEQEDKDKFGNVLTYTLIETFYQLNENIEVANTSEYEACRSVRSAFFNEIYNYNRYSLGYICLNETVPVSAGVKVLIANTTVDWIINFNWLLAPICGIVVLYFLINYCLKIGMRIFQIMFLEVISPMAIIGYLSPKKDNMLTKWWKIYLSTYLDVFIRIAIINFVIFLINVLFTTGDGFIIWDSLGNPTGIEVMFFKVVLIISLLAFAKKCPDLLKDMLGTNASKLGFGLGTKDIFNEYHGLLAGAATGGAIGLLGGGIPGFFGGIFRGGKAGFDAKSLFKGATSAREKVAKHNLERQQDKLAGVRWYDSIAKGWNQSIGKVGEYEQLEAEVASYKELKADIEDSDEVKDAKWLADKEYETYVETAQKRGLRALTKDDWFKSTADGMIAKSRTENAENKAWTELYDKNKGGFKSKVEMHNRRFKSKYDRNTGWGPVNANRKATTENFEKIKARKPKK